MTWVGSDISYNVIMLSCCMYLDPFFFYVKHNGPMQASHGSAARRAGGTSIETAAAARDVSYMVWLSCCSVYLDPFFLTSNIKATERLFPPRANANLSW